MKKGLTILTALVILITSLPMSAMAAGGLISSEDLTAAVLLTAQDVPLSEHDARRLSYEIREGAKEIRTVRSEMAAEAGSMLKKLQEMEDALQGGSYAVGAGGETAEPEMQLIDSWNDQLLGDAYQKTVSLTASAADLFPQQQTLLERLSPISSASAADL